MYGNKNTNFLPHTWTNAMPHVSYGENLLVDLEVDPITCFPYHGCILFNIKPTLVWVRDNGSLPTILAVKIMNWIIHPFIAMNSTGKQK